ncbi:response regulator transcription factor [Actinopolymorpha singaporensis]|uniref:Response regulator receiver domain-containing protein n=1 Tax=Actinopolymorpha singaporensis TaxID=117157 RepID=A0A1H1SYV6_9ACTN|nr:response regulator transcription factor [Actinopolymorpha singaporensis]SDS53111.1 Response regulator receiver domain-containing protein [Actinopolymorpha singaporensis]
MVVVGNHPELVDALVDLLTDEPDLELLGVAGKSEEVLALVQAPRAPDVLLFDIDSYIQSSIESTGSKDAPVVNDLSRRLPNTRLVALSNYDDIAAVGQTLEAGFHRHVSKRFVEQDLAAILKEEHANLG